MSVFMHDLCYNYVYLRLYLIYCWELELNSYIQLYVVVALFIGFVENYE